MESSTTEGLLGLIQGLEKRADAQELLVSSLLQAYMEMWATVELLMDQMLGTKTEEQRQAFLADFNQIRAAMWQGIKEAGASALADLDPEIKAKLAHLVTGDSDAGDVD